MDAIEKARLDTRAAFDKWIKRLGLAWWDIDIIYESDPATVLHTFKAIEGEGIVNMQVSVNWMYGEACIEVNLLAMQGKTVEQTERIVVHELLHILVNEMNEHEGHHEERVVTSLTKAVFWVDSFAREDVAAVEGQSSSAAPPPNDSEIAYF